MDILKAQEQKQSYLRWILENKSKREIPHLLQMVEYLSLMLSFPTFLGLASTLLATGLYVGIDHSNMHAHQPVFSMSETFRIVLILPLAGHYSLDLERPLKVHVLKA
jgi:hypothetical protein